MKTLIYKPRCGTSLNFACNHATKLARNANCKVKFCFNDVILVASPKKSKFTLNWEYDIIGGQKYESYRVSKKGQDEYRKRIEEIKLNQDTVTAAIKTLPGLIEINDLDYLIGWLYSFVEPADDIGVDINLASGLKTGGHEWIAILFESKGYKENEFVGNPPEWFDSREKMGRYIIGQCINCLHKGFTPYPHIVQSFSKKYYELPKS